ncbi:MAG TPA: pilus assembly protein CpaF, partial [Planctomycetaceae bacterium]|nr:pilus assembly protein CpaF [Planctomycetaceae bacterium]
SVVRQYVTAGIKLVVHVARLKGGARRVMSISEIVGLENGDYQLEEIFGFRQQGLDQDGVAKGEFYTTGYQPKCIETFADEGVEVPASVFAK